MPTHELPHTAGCLVCGRDNPHGLHLTLNVDEATGVVTTDFLTRPEHIGFEGIVHGGLLATVVDEAMVWAATWAGRRFCVCGELNVRYRNSAPVGMALRCEAKVEALRSRLVEATATISDAGGVIYTTASAKYVPVPAGRNAAFVATLVPSASVERTISVLRAAANPTAQPT